MELTRSIRTFAVATASSSPKSTMNVLVGMVRNAAAGLLLLPPLLLGGCFPNVNPDCRTPEGNTADTTGQTQFCDGPVFSGPATPTVPVVDETLVVARGGSVAMIDLSSHQIIREIPVGNAPSSAVGLSDGRLTYFPDNGISKVGVLDGVTEERLDAIPVDDPQLARGGVSTDRAASAMSGHLMYVTMAYPIDGMVGVFDTTVDSVGQPGHGKLLKRIPMPVDFPGKPIAIAATPSGSRIYVLTTKAGGAAISVIDAVVQPVVDQQVIESFALPPGSGWDSIAIHPNGDILYVTSAAGLSIVDIKSGSNTRNTVVGTLGLGSQPGDMAFSRGVSGFYYLFVLSPGSGSLIVVDVLQSSPTRHTIVGSGFSGSARFLAVGDVGIYPTVYLADDARATTLSPQVRAAGNPSYVPSASVPLPRPASGIGFHAGVTPTPDHLYVSLAARGAAQFTMFDGELAAWTTSKIFDTTAMAAAIVGVAQVTSGGNPGSFRQTTHIWTGGTDANGAALGFEAGHLRDGARHDPSRFGAIDHLDWSFDDKVISQVGGTPGVATFALLRQGGYWFNHYDVNTAGNWTAHSYRGLRATDFVNPSAGPVNPDFSATGGLIEFGYGTANGTSTAVPITTKSGIDNWSVTVVLQ